MSKKLIVIVFAAVVGLFSSTGFSQSAPSKDFPGIKISNFGKMDDRFYRGGRPGKKDFEALKSIGINTIIDLTDNTPQEKGLAEAAGLKYVNIPIEDKTYPTDGTIAKFLETVNDPSTGVFYVHCAGGRHRTGDMGAVYRLNAGWDFDKTFKEMENYDFYTSNGHGKQKDFVVDYAAKMASQRTAAATAAVAGVANK